MTRPLDTGRVTAHDWVETDPHHTGARKMTTMTTDPEEYTAASDRRKLVDHALQAAGLGTSREWLSARRAEKLSWVDVRSALRDAIGWTVSYETLRRWSAQDQGGTDEDPQ